MVFEALCSSLFIPGCLCFQESIFQQLVQVCRPALDGLPEAAYNDYSHLPLPVPLAPVELLQGHERHEAVAEPWGRNRSYATLDTPPGSRQSRARHLILRFQLLALESLCWVLPFQLISQLCQLRQLCQLSRRIAPS